VVLRGLRRLSIGSLCALSIVGFSINSVDRVNAGPQAQVTRTLPTTGTSTPPGPSVTLTLLANATKPIGLIARPNDKTLFALDKIGKVSALTSEGLSTEPVLDVRDRIDETNERGLIGLAFSPIDDTHLYVFYTDRSGTLVVSEFPFDGKKADASKERVLLTQPHPNDDHNGGTLAFSRDGLLWIAFGDGGGVGVKGGVGDRDNNAQNVNVLLGKILRIDPRSGSDGKPYQIPKSNPFAKGFAGGLGNTRKARPEIYEYGIRNPWRFTISSDGFLWIPDVGQSSWEEINRVPVSLAGANFGWRLREGMHAYRGGGKPRGAIDPIFEFQHADGRCAVVGGAPAVSGPWSVGGADSGIAASSGVLRAYYFGEICSGRVFQLADSGKTVKVTQLDLELASLTSVNIANDGQLYVTSLNGGIYLVDKR
jgi:glucose/arabinose dehydrogenase